MNEAGAGQSKPTILVVDDEPLLRMDLAALLEDAGYQVLEVADAGAAIVLLQSARGIRMLLTDVHIPGEFNGVELAHLVAERWPAIGIVIMSGVARPKAASLPRHAAFISKPFDAATALALVGDSIGGD